MSGSAKNKGPFWYGFLEAGDKSTAVIRDDRLDTGNRKTLYLFNLKRKEILEYTREVVDPKLRELKPAESELIAELEAAYNEARRAFKARGARLNIPERGGATAPARSTDKAEGLDEFDGDDEDGAWVDSEEEEET